MYSYKINISDEMYEALTGETRSDKFHNSIPTPKINLTGKKINTKVFEELEIIESIPNT